MCKLKYLYVHGSVAYRTVEESPMGIRRRLTKWVILATVFAPDGKYYLVMRKRFLGFLLGMTMYVKCVPKSEQTA